MWFWPRWSKNRRTRCFHTDFHHEDQFEFDPLLAFFFRQCQLYPGRYLSWVHTAHCSSSNRVCAVPRIPSCLLPSDSSSLAGPQSSVCTGSINGIVRKQWGLYILTWMDVWGSFYFGRQGYSEPPVCSQAPLVCCVSRQLGSTDWSCWIVIEFFF